MLSGKRQKINVLLATVILVLLSFSLTGYTLNSSALPTGGKITSGKGSISSVGRQMTINQSTDKMIASWETFNIGRMAGVTFNQPGKDSVALNKIYDQSPSRILGSLSANGNIYLINPSGIVFGEGAQVNVGGLVASSLNIADSDFLSGKYTFLNTGNAGNILNQGEISVTPGGVVALIAPQVVNEGTITANGGSVILGAGKQISLDFTGDGLISYTMNKGAVDALAENSGLIKADGGIIVMTAKAADALTSTVVNNSGVIEAQTLANKAGRIILMSDMVSGTTVVDGKLDASAPNGGDGGFIETSAAEVEVNDGAVITTLASRGKTGTWLIDPKDYNVAASGGNITGAALSANLGTNNVTILNYNGTTGTQGNVNINDDISWSANTTLTLNAYRNVNINADITATGATAGLVITPNTGNVGGSYNLNNGAVITLSGANPSLTIAGNVYTVINNVTALQNMNSNLAGYYALGSNINASVTSGWNAGAGFVPVGTYGSGFTGQFDGLGHTITGLTINRAAENYLGLFGVNYGTVRNVGMVGGSVGGNSFVGGLVGANPGTVLNAYTTGSVTGSGNYVGGLVGHNGDTITNSYATGSVTGTASSSEVGGLVGENEGTITDSHATGNVTSGSDFVGGLVGFNKKTVSNSYATGIVTGDDYVGGLAGMNSDTVNGNSYATGNVTGGLNYVGGLVGYNNGGTVADAFATGDVTGSGYSVGGLAGNNTGTIDHCHAEGKVTGVDYTGGLVGYDSSSIVDSYATGNVISTGYDVGGLVGVKWYGDIRNSYATGNVTSTQNEVGGLVGNNYGATITNSYASGTVSGKWYVGGLVGYNTGSITNAYATGDATATTSHVGGLVGYNAGGTITSTYATGHISGASIPGGLIGENSGTVINSYWDTTTSGTATGIFSGTLTGATGLTTAGMMQTWNMLGLDFAYTWWLSSGNTRPFLRSEYSTTIVNAHQLQLMALNLAASYTLGADINMAELAKSSGMWNTATGFVPVGGYGYFFRGRFDGLGHTITDLHINRPLQDYVGLFGVIFSGVSVGNVGLIGGSVTAHDYVGSLVGGIYKGTVSNAYATGSVSGENYIGGLVGGSRKGLLINSYATGAVNGTNYIGGLLGGNQQGIVTTSYATGKISGVNYVGGLVGGSTKGSIINSYATGNVSGTGTVISLSELGGFVGGLVGGISKSTVIDSHATGDVTGGDLVGGLVGGKVKGSIAQSYATGNVSGGFAVGGLVGVNKKGSIVNAYATGDVSGTDSVGGLIGAVYKGAIADTYANGSVTGTTTVGGFIGYNGGKVSGSYWDTTTSGTLTGIGGGNIIGASGVPTNQMMQQATFVGWDFANIWEITEGVTYPTLQ